MSNYGNVSARNLDFWSIRRTEVGYRIEDLADKVGVRQPTLNNWFFGRNIPRDRVYIYRLCKCLEVDYYDGLSKFGLYPSVFADTLAKHNTLLTDLEELLDISSKTISAYVRRKCCPNFSIVAKIADLLNIDAKSFYNEIKADVQAAKSDMTTDNLENVPEISDLTQISSLTVDTNIPTQNISKLDLTTIKGVFNAFYDFIDLDLLFTLIKYVRQYNFDWATVLDALYDSRELHRSAYDDVVNLFKEFGIYS